MKINGPQHETVTSLGANLEQVTTLGANLERLLWNLSAFDAKSSPRWFCSVLDWINLRVWVDRWESLPKIVSLNSGRIWFWMVRVFTLNYSSTYICPLALTNIIFTLSQRYFDYFFDNWYYLISVVTLVTTVLNYRRYTCYYRS